MFIGFLIERNKFKVVVNGKLSDYINDQIQSFVNVNILDDTKEFGGRIFLEDFKVMSSADVLYYKNISKKNLCKNKCEHFESIKEMKCLQCGSNTVMQDS